MPKYLPATRFVQDADYMYAVGVITRLHAMIELVIIRDDLPLGLKEWLVNNPNMKIAKSYLEHETSFYTPS